jgi:O-succinylbenzoate synthase
MFESGYARAVNTALAALPGFDLPGDLAPSTTYLTEDVVPAPHLDRHAPDGRLRVGLHLAPGLGPAPDRTIVARRSAASWRWPSR